MDETNMTARLSLRFKKDEEKTYLSSQYYKLPLQVLPPHYQDEDGTSFVYLLNPSGGIMQGDRLLTEIYVEDKASVVATTPASTKYYKMEDDHAVVCNEFYVGSGAVFEYMPGHGVPFSGADVIQNNVFHLEEESILIALDAVTSGRKARGEQFGYTRFCSKTSIDISGRVILYDCMDIRPQEENVKKIGILEENEIIASMYLYKRNSSDQVKEEMAKFINPVGDTKVGVTSVTDDLVLVRILGCSILDYKDNIIKIWDAARKAMLGKKCVKFRKY